MRRALPAQAGIAIAPILFVIAIIGVIIAALSAGGNSLGGSAIREDKIIADIRGQIDLIRSKVDECVMLTRQSSAPQFLYPAYDNLNNAVAVSALTCPREAASLWTGKHPASLPPVPNGFAPWQYMNHGNPDDGISPGGICISIVPLDATRASDPMLQAAMKSILKRFDASEYTFDSTTQRLILWIKRPVSGTTC